jgi:predicted double-glycine peptidase
LPATELAKLHGPAIVRLKKSESFQHLVVLRKVGDGVFYLSDPVVGQVAQSSAQFQEQYTGDVLAIWRRGSPLPQAALLAWPRDAISVSKQFGEGNQ